MEVQCLSEFLPMFDIEPRDYFSVMAEDLKKFISIPGDTIRCLHMLRGKGIALYTASTNSPFMPGTNCPRQILRTSKTVPF